MTVPADRTVAIWRSCLLPASETFVRHHGDALTTWRPAYLGAVTVASPLAADTDVVVCPDTRRGRLDWLLLRLTGRSGRLGRALADTGAAVVHAHFGGDAWLVSRAAARLGVPLIVTLHGLDVTSQARRPGPRGARHRRHLRTVFDRAALVLAVSEFIRDRAIALGADPAKVRVHHTGIPLTGAPTVHKSWDVVFVGRFVAKKGLDDLIEALGLLSDLRPRTLLIGAGPMEQPLRARATALGLDVTFLGVQPPAAVRRHVAASKVLAAPSKTAADGDTEGLPTTVLEAASLGLPVAATRHSGIPEAVLHGETGLLSAEGDHPALADNLRRLLTDATLRTRLGDRARNHVHAHFDLRTRTRELERLYDLVTRGSGSGGQPPHRSAGGAPRHPDAADQGTAQPRRAGVAE